MPSRVNFDNAHIHNFHNAEIRQPTPESERTLFVSLVFNYYTDKSGCLKDPESGFWMPQGDAFGGFVFPSLGPLCYVFLCI